MASDKRDRDAKGRPAREDAVKVEKSDYGLARRAAFCVAVIGLLVGGAGGWAATAELAGAIVTHGSVIVDGRIKKVQHRDGGIVSAVNVKNGDHVGEGQILVQLDGTQTRAELGVVQSQLTELRVRQARLKAVSDHAESIAFPVSLLGEANTEILKSENRLFEDDLKTRESQKEQLSLRVEQLEDEARGLSAQEKAKSSELGLIKKELLSVTRLNDEKLTPITRVYALQREETKLSGEHGNLIAQLARVRGQTSEIHLQLLNIDQTARAEAQRELRTIEGKIAELVEREVASIDRLQRTDIRAPASGIVHQIQVNTVGGVITSAEPVLLIVPDGHAMSVEVRIPPSDIDQVRIGQEVRLRFSSFNQRTTPEVMGQISYISADIVTDPKAHADFYSVLVKLSGPSATTIGDRPILPGMPVEAFVTTSTRTALSYFVKPITDQFQRALREE